MFDEMAGDALDDADEVADEVDFLLVPATPAVERPYDRVLEAVPPTVRDACTTDAFEAVLSKPPKPLQLVMCEGAYCLVDFFDRRGLAWRKPTFIRQSRSPVVIPY